MSTFEKIIDRIWAAQNQSQQAEEAVQQKKQQITAPKTEKAPATKPVQTAQSTDTRTTAQKAADSKAAYTAYQGSEEQKKNQGEANKKALQEVMDRLFAVPNTSMGEMPLVGMPVKGMPVGVASPIPVDQKEQELKAAADYHAGQLKMEQDKAMMDADLAEYESWSAQDKANMEQYLEERDRYQNNIFGAPQFDTYNLNPLFQTKDPAKVRQMAESIQRSRNAQAMEQATAAADQLAQEHPVLGSAASVATNLASAYTAPVEIAKEMANRTGRYQTMDPNNLGGIGQQFGGTVRQNVSQQIEGENGNWLRKLAAVGYEGVMSAADSTARMAAGGFNPGVSAAIAASGGFSNSLRQYSAQGATPEQAAAAALATAGIEYITEKIPMDELLKVGKGGWKNVLKQAFLTEPTTEEISLFAGVAAETMILGKNSDRSQKIGELVANGMSYQEATEQLDKQLWMEAARTYGVSAVAGGMSGAGAKKVYDIQTAMDELGAELAKNMPAEQPVQLTEGQRAVQQAADEVMGVQPVEQTAAEVAGVEPTQAESAQDEVIRENVKNNLWKNYRGKQDDDGQVSDGWQAVTDNSVWATALAMKEVNPDYFNAYMDSAENEQLSPIIDAVINAAEDVRQESISPMAAATVINEVFEQHGESGLQQMYNPRNGNLYDSVLNRMKAVDSTIGNGETDEQTSRVKGTGAAEQNFSGKAEYQDLLYEGNVQPDRAGDVRPMEVPKTDTYGRNVSEFVGNAYGAEITPDSMANTIEELVQEGALGFDRRSNQDALNDAAKVIAGSTPATITRRITANIANGKIKDGDIEQAMLLYSHYANKNGKRAQEQAAELMVDLTTMAHMTGRNLQLFKLLRQLTPEGQSYVVKRTVENNVERLIRSGQVKKGYSTEVDPELLSEYQKAAAENARAVSDEQKQQSAEKMQQIQQAIFAAEAAKMPATFKAKWDAWRYMAMLGNIKTQGRNVGGNVLFTPYKEAKDKLAALFEKATPKDQRTKSFFQDRELVSWAKEDAASNDVKNALKYSAKLGDDVTNAQFAESRKIFDNEALDNVRKFVEKVPGMGDMIFKNGHYARSLAGFLKARGYDAETVRAGQVSDAVMAEARGYAIQEAMKATFNDSNAFSDAFAGIGRKNTDNFWSKALNVAAEGILPFRRTPANIVVRFAEYSPVGLAKGVWDMARNVQSGKISAAAAIDQISAGMTGSAAMVLGYFLAKGMMGVKLTGSGADEDEKRQGHQDYALEFSINGQEYSYKIDWAAPANLPLFVGANIYQMIEDRGGNTDVSVFTSILHGMATMFEPMLALSCMSSLNDLLEGVRYAPEGEALYSAAVDIATSYFTQGIPALARQAYQASQKNKQTTFANSADPTIRDLQKLGANVPFVGAAFQTDKVNAWGETETTESGVLRAINAFINPGTFKAIDNGELEREITRLNQAQNLNVSPPVASKTVDYTDTSGENHKGQRLTEEQYQTMAKTQGQTAAKLLDRIIKTSYYKAMTDQQKAYAFDAVYQYAQELGKKAAISDYHSEADAWIREATPDDIAPFIKRGASGPLQNAVDNTVAAISNGWKVTGADKKAMEETYASYTKLSDEAKEQVRDGATGDTDKYLKVRDAGVDTASYIKAVEAVKALKPEGEHKDVVPGQRWEAALEGGTTNEAKDALVKAYMDDYDPESSSPDKTELKYDYLRQELNRSPEDAIAIIRAQQSGNKDAKMAKWAAMGYTKAECDILWNLFGSTSKTKAIDVVSWHNSKTE